MFDFDGSHPDRPSVVWSVFFNQSSRKHRDDLPENFFIPDELDSSISVDNILLEAESIFESICPGEEFIPLVPNPEDIIYVLFCWNR